jgi:hypothetical protein
MEIYMNKAVFAQTVSLLLAIFLLLAGTTSILRITIPSLIFGFLSVLFFLILIICIYNFSIKHTIWGHLSISFAIMYGILISLNYYIQLSFLGRQIEIPDLLSMENMDSIFLSVEILGYFFMGMATLTSIPLITGKNLANWIRICFWTNGILGIGGLIGYACSWHFELLMGGLVVWNIIMPMAAVLLFFYFKKLPATTPQ